MGSRSIRRLTFVGVVLLSLGVVHSVPSPILDFLDPFLTPEPTDKGPILEKGKDFEGGGGDGLSGSGALAASGRLDGGPLGFNADGSVAASNSFGVDNGIDDVHGEVIHPQDKFQDNEFHPQFQEDPHQFKEGPIPRPHPPPQRIHPIPQKQPCSHPIPRPLVPISNNRFNQNQRPLPPPQNQRNGPFFKKNFRGLTKNMENLHQEEAIDHKDPNVYQKRGIQESAGQGQQGQGQISGQGKDPSYQVNGSEPAQVGGPQFDPKAALRLARNLLDKAILNKVKNSSSPINSTDVPTSKSARALAPVDPDDEDDFEAVDVDRDGDIDEDDEDFLKHARSLLNDAISHQPAAGEKVKVNATQVKVNTTSMKRSIPIVVLEEVKFVPLHNATKNDSSSQDPSQKDFVVRSVPSVNVTTNATEVKEANTTKREEERPISPKMMGISHMFHNMFAG